MLSLVILSIFYLRSNENYQIGKYLLCLLRTLLFESLHQIEINGL